MQETSGKSDTFWNNSGKSLYYTVCEEEVADEDRNVHGGKESAPPGKDERFVNKEPGSKYN